ncbi:MAG TPA: hypothetical protein VGA97_09740 [Acidimicrobiia bacterium]
MKRGLLIIALLAACSGNADPTITTTAPATTSQTSATAPTTTLPPECPSVPYSVSRLPQRVTAEPAPADTVELDEFTSIGGTTSVLWVDAAGEVAVALIRGTLPLEDWPGERGQVDVAGVPAVVGPFDDGRWVAAWFEEEGERCDLYTMVFYPPVDASEVELSLASIVRDP